MFSRKKNDSSKVSIFIDDKYAFSLDEVDALVMGIKPGKEIERERLGEIVFASKFAKAKRDALNLISRKSVSKKMVEDLLFEKGFDKEIADAVCGELEELGYIDDYAYASLFTEYALEKNWGKRKICYELSVKGVSKEIVDEVVSEATVADAKSLSEIIMEKYRGLDYEDIKVKQKIQRYFVSRGFDFSEITEAINICISIKDEN